MKDFLLTDYKSQKRIAAINDISGYGRCSITVELPIISAMGIECAVMPTAILSTHTGFDGFTKLDYTNYMKAHMNQWKNLSLYFNGICSGYLGSYEQIELVIEFIEMFKQKDTIVVIDPIMGDYGKLYKTFTESMCNKMVDLIKHADVITPNITEACKLLNIDYIKSVPSKEILDSLGQKLSKLGPSKIVITGIECDNKILNYIFENGKESQIIEVKKIGECRCGTGDVFSSVLAGSMVKGINFYDSVKNAIDFINKAIEYTCKINVPNNCGLAFEPFLKEL